MFRLIAHGGRLVQIGDIYARPKSATLDVEHHALDSREEAGAGDTFDVARQMDELVLF